MSASLDIAIFNKVRKFCAKSDDQHPGLAYVNVWDDGYGNRYYEASDKNILIRRREDLPDGWKCVGELESPIRVSPYAVPARPHWLEVRFTPKPTDIVDIDFPSFNDIIPKKLFENKCDTEKARPYIEAKYLNIIQEVLKLDFDEFRVNYSLDDPDKSFGRMFQFNGEFTTVICMGKIPTETIEVVSENKVVQKVEITRTQKLIQVALHDGQTLVLIADKDNPLNEPEEVLATIKKLMADKGFDDDNAVGLQEVLKELELEFHNPEQKKQKKKEDKFIPPSSSFEEFLSNVERDKKMLSQYLLADNLKISWKPSKTKISTLAEVFTELYMQMGCDNIYTFIRLNGNLFTEKQLEQIMLGRAYIPPVMFKYIRKKALFAISDKKLSKLNLDVIKTAKNAVCIDLDLKLLGELTRGAEKERAAIQREKRRVYNLEVRRKNKDSGEYEDCFGNKTSVTPARRISIDKTREKRRAKNKLAETICPAYLFFMDLKNSKSYTIKNIRNKVVVDENGKRRLVDPESGKPRRNYQTRIYHTESSPEAAAIHCRFPNHGKKPLKIKSTCPAFIQEDYSLCPFMKDVNYIYNADFGKCEMATALMMFRGCAENTLQIYIDQINEQQKKIAAQKPKPAEAEEEILLCRKYETVCDKGNWQACYGCEGWDASEAVPAPDDIKELIKERDHGDITDEDLDTAISKYLGAITDWHSIMTR